MQHPRSVFQVMKAFYARYTPEAVANICGCTAEEFVKTAELMTSTYTRERAGTIMYALGWTHHSHSVQLIHAAAMLQLLLGNVGRAGRRRQRAARPRQHPGRHRLRRRVPQPARLHPDPESRSRVARAFVNAVTPKPLRAERHELLVEHRSFTVSQLKAYTAACDARQRVRLRVHPRLPQDEPAATRTGAGPTSSTTCTPAAWRGSSASG